MRYYNRGDKQYKSVTSILSEMFPFTEEAQRRYEDKVARFGLTVEHVSALSKAMGTKVSMWIDNACKHTEYLNPPCLSEKEEGLYKAVEKFLDEVELIETEKEVYCDEYQFAGTFDMKYKLCKTGELFLSDAKTFGAWEREPYKRSTDKLKKAGIQTDMYAYADNCYDIKRSVVVFKTDGTYDIELRKRHDSQWIEYLLKQQEENEELS